LAAQRERKILFLPFFILFLTGAQKNTADEGLFIYKRFIVISKKTGSRVLWASFQPYRISFIHNLMGKVYNPKYSRWIITGARLNYENLLPIALAIEIDQKICSSLGGRRVYIPFITIITATRHYLWTKWPLLAGN
jgi:hypothetical protein